jgi:hypothetical protein
MKNILILLFFAAILFSCNLRKPNLDSVKRTDMEIVDTVRHYYPILRGSELNVSYKIYNRGQDPLIIYDVQASCGCIDISYPKTSIGKEDFGFINLNYDSAKNIGFVEFFITIVANTKKDIFTTIKFDINVVTSPHYTQDYEEIYIERRKAKMAESVDGDLTKQGYYVDDTETVR